jgi:hypothetical protein
LSINLNKLYSVGDDLLQEYYGEDFNGDFIECYARLSRMDFGSAAQVKKIKKEKCLFTEGSDNDFYIKYIYDGDPSIYEEKLITENYGDTFILADDAETYGGILADDAETYGNILDPLISLLKYIFKPAKKFCLLEIEVSCREAGQNFSIERIELQRIKVKV